MVEQDNAPPPGHDSGTTSDNAEALVFAKIVRYLSERLGDVEPDADPGDLNHMGELFDEIAEAFEETGGFEFSSDQALPLSHAFAMLEGGMRILADQAHDLGQSNAAAKMEWAALKARGMTARLETHHLSGAGGIVAFGQDGVGDDAADEAI